MDDSLPSKTCLYVAAGRALGARDPDPAVRNPDYLAERLLGPQERALVSEQACVRALDDAEMSKNMEALGSALMMQVRTRFIEDRLAEEVAKGVRQVVILGAGFDTKAYRLTQLLKDARVFEVDRAATQEYKRRRIREAGIEVPTNLIYVPVDFRKDSLGAVLEKASYDPSKETFFIWEGVTMYLPETAVAETLSWVARQAKGSTIIFDFIYQATLDFLAALPNLENLPEQAKQAIARVQKLEAGEPWVFGIPNGGEGEFLGRFGLQLRKLLPVGGEESRERYLIRSDGSFYVPLPPGMTRPPVGAAANPSYCLLEAGV